MNLLFLITCVVLLTQNVLTDDPTYLFRIARIQHSGIKPKVRQVQNIEYFDNDLVNASQLRIVTAVMAVLYERSFRNMENLKILQMPKCNIQEIHPGAFEGVPNLDRIQLQDNSLSKIEKGVFNYLNLSQLYLHRNNISYIHSEAFDNMPNLHTIKLNSNQIKMWDSNWFFNTPKLTEVYIRRNFITRLEDNSFKNIKKLQAGYGDNRNATNIYLSKNKISWIHPQALSELVKLNHFYLDRNNLSDIPEELFSQIESITYLNLRRNKFIKISTRMFPRVTTFETLDLTKNDLACIPEEIAIQADKIFLQDNFISCDCVSKLKKFVKDKGKKNNLVFGNCVRQQEEINDEDEEEYEEEEDEEDDEAEE